MFHNRFKSSSFSPNLQEIAGNFAAFFAVSRTCFGLSYRKTEFTRQTVQVHCTVYTLKKELKCSRDSEILHEIVRDTTRKSEKYELVRIVSRTISCRISKSTLHFISFLTVYAATIYKTP